MLVMGSILRIGSGTVRLLDFVQSVERVAYVDPVGIGLEVHEDPYLRGGSSDIIATGHSFSNEPGVYIEGKVCVCDLLTCVRLTWLPLGWCPAGRLLLYRRGRKPCLFDGGGGWTSQESLGALISLT